MSNVYTSKWNLMTGIFTYIYHYKPKIYHIPIHIQTPYEEVFEALNIS